MTMKRMGRVLGMFAVLLAVAVSAEAQSYTITDLGTLGGTFSFGNGVNSSGQVTGYSSLSGDSVYHPFLYSNGTMTDLGVPNGWTGTLAEGTAINDSGQVTGWGGVCGSDIPTTVHAFLYSNGVTTDLGSSAPTYCGGIVVSAGTRGLGINASGTVTGSDNANTFVYSAGVRTDLLSHSIGAGINITGNIIGWLFGGTRHAFFMPYPYTSSYDLGTLGGILSFGRGINDSNQVVGDANLPDGSDHAFLCSGANCTMTDLGTLAGDATSEALAINNSGQIVGWSQGGFVQRGFLYTSGAMADLNSLLPSDSGWSITQGTAINDSGQITGLGTHNGAGRAFLMTPPPSPYKAYIQQPINADGSSVFSAKQGVVPVMFTLTLNGTATCSLPAATIALTRTAGGTLGAIDESVYSMPADDGSNFRIDTTACQYVYNLNSKSFGAGVYRVDILIAGSVVGSSTFALK